LLFDVPPIKNWLTNLGHLDMSRSRGCKLSNGISHVTLELAWWIVIDIAIPTSCHQMLVGCMGGLWNIHIKKNDKLLKRNHENKGETQFCCDSRCQGEQEPWFVVMEYLNVQVLRMFSLYTFSKTMIHYCWDQMWMLRKYKTMHHWPKLLMIVGKSIKSTLHIYVKHVPYMHFNFIMIVT
jgi:hypothetical protein